VSDIILNDGDDGVWVTMEAAVTNVKGSDLVLEQKVFRTPKGGPFRHALVHNPQDGISLNRRLCAASHLFRSAVCGVAGRGASIRGEQTSRACLAERVFV